MNWSTISANIIQSAQDTSVSEWIATVTAVIYVILATRENIYCWHFGAISSALSVAVYFHERFYFEGILNVAYCIISVYGWWEWRTKGKNGSEKNVLKISTLKFKLGALLFLGGILLSAICGGISSYYKTSSLPYADAAITIFSIIATWMTAKKILENWILWIIIDASAAVVYIYKGPSLYLFALLFIFYTFIAIYGFLKWRKSLNQFTA